MEGFIVISTQTNLNFRRYFSNNYIVKKDKKIYYVNSLENINEMDVVFNACNNEAVNYITKRVKVCSWVTGKIKNSNELALAYRLNKFSLPELFIEALSNNTKLKPFVKDFWSMLHGTYSCCLAYLTANTRSHITLLEKNCSVYVSLLKKDETLLLVFGSSLTMYDTLIHSYGYEVIHARKVNNYLTLYPLYLVSKFRERKNKYSFNVALGSLIKYLES